MSARRQPGGAAAAAKDVAEPARIAPEQPLSDEESTFILGGHACRVVCVDSLLPQHQDTPCSSRTRQRYLPDEVVHFDLGAHRYALVVDREPQATPSRLDGDIHALLTNRELQIVQLICSGLLTKQVSDRLRISEFTVRSYLKTIYCKLGVRSRGAMVYAYAQSMSRAQHAAPTHVRAAEAGASVGPRAWVDGQAL